MIEGRIWKVLGPEPLTERCCRCVFGLREAIPGLDILSNLICPLGSHPRRCNFLETVSILTQFSLLMGRPK